MFFHASSSRSEGSARSNSSSLCSPPFWHLLALQLRRTCENGDPDSTLYAAALLKPLAGNYAQIATAKAQQTSYADKSAAPDTTYSYRVRAYNGAGDSGFSNQAHARPTPGPHRPRCAAMRTGTEASRRTMPFAF